MDARLTPKESNVYSGLFRPRYDSYGVEFRYEYPIFYKHSIPLGWVSIDYYFL